MQMVSGRVAQHSVAGQRIERLNVGLVFLGVENIDQHRFAVVADRPFVWMRGSLGNQALRGSRHWIRAQSKKRQNERAARAERLGRARGEERMDLHRHPFQDSAPAKPQFHSWRNRISPPCLSAG